MIIPFRDNKVYAVMQFLHSHYSSCCSAISTLSCSIILMSFDSPVSYFWTNYFDVFAIIVHLKANIKFGKIHLFSLLLLKYDP